MRSFLFVIFFALVLIPAVVSAHLEGVTYTQEVDGKLLSIGTNTETPQAGSAVRFTFLIEDIETDKKVDFTDIWVRIYQDRKTFFASGIHRPEFGDTGILYTFETPGEYIISARFQNEGEILSEVKSPVDVAPGGKSNNSDVPLTAILIGALGGFLLAGVLFILRSRLQTSGD